ncbi:MAG: hypothetical protein V8Q21_06500 [Akkermansia muciniphila]
MISLWTSLVSAYPAVLLITMNGNRKREKPDPCMWIRKQNPMPLSVAGMVDAIDKGTAKIICVEAAGLMEYSAAVLGSGGVSSRGVGWTETRKTTNVQGQEEIKSWRSGHAWCLYGGKVHNPVPYNAGSTNKSESDYIKDDLKSDENRSNFTEPGDRHFSFNK